MKLELFAIYDSAAKAFLPPFVAASESVVLRQLVKVMEEQPNHDFVRYSDQYVLYQLAHWDNESGELHDLGQISIGSLLVIKNRVKVVEG